MLLTKFPCSKLHLVFFRSKLRFRCHRAMFRTSCAGLASLFHKHGHNFLIIFLKKGPTPSSPNKHYRNTCWPAEIQSNSFKVRFLILSPQRLFSPNATPHLPPPAERSAWLRKDSELNQPSSLNCWGLPCCQRAYQRRERIKMCPVTTHGEVLGKNKFIKSRKTRSRGLNTHGYWSD